MDRCAGRLRRSIGVHQPEPARAVIEQAVEIRLQVAVLDAIHDGVEGELRNVGLSKTLVLVPADLGGNHRARGGGELGEAVEPLDRPIGALPEVRVGVGVGIVGVGGQIADRAVVALPVVRGGPTGAEAHVDDGQAERAAGCVDLLLELRGDRQRVAEAGWVGVILLVAAFEEIENARLGKLRHEAKVGGHSGR